MGCVIAGDACRANWSPALSGALLTNERYLMSEILDDERMTLLEQHLAELQERAKALEDRPWELRRQLRASEEAGDVEGADEAERQLAVLVGGAEALALRVNAVRAIKDDQALQRRIRDQQAECERNRRQREWEAWADATNSHPPLSSEKVAQRAAAAAAHEEAEKRARQRVNAIGVGVSQVPAWSVRPG